MMKDLYRHKDKLKLVLDKMSTIVTKMVIEKAKLANHPIVFIPVHWAPDAFMSRSSSRNSGGRRSARC